MPFAIESSRGNQKQTTKNSNGNREHFPYCNLM